MCALVLVGLYFAFDAPYHIHTATFGAQAH